MSSPGETSSHEVFDSGHVWMHVLILWSTLTCALTDVESSPTQSSFDGKKDRAQTVVRSLHYLICVKKYSDCTVDSTFKIYIIQYNCCTAILQKVKMWRVTTRNALTNYWLDGLRDTAEDTSVDLDCFRWSNFSFNFWASVSLTSGGQSAFNFHFKDTCHVCSEEHTKKR